MQIKQDVTILGITRYNFVNDNGEPVKGTTVHYYDMGGVSEENRYGVLPQKANLALETYDDLKAHVFPTKAIANVSIDLTKGKMKVANFEFGK